MKTSLHQQLLALALLSTALVLSGCGAVLPARTGYDRNTGTWKRAGGTKAKTAKATSTSSPTKGTEAPAAALGTVIKGQASFYGKELAGHATANGESFDPDAATCAHRTLPFGTRLKVTYLKKSTSTVVRVNDRGPNKDGRVLDLSRAAADDLGLTADGVGLVEAEVVP